MKQIVDKLNKIAKAIDSDVTISNRKLIVDSLDSITTAFGGTKTNSKLIVDKLEDIANCVHGGGEIEKHYVIPEGSYTSMIEPISGMAGIYIPNSYFFAPELFFTIDGVTTKLVGMSTLESGLAGVYFVDPNNPNAAIVEVYPNFMDMVSGVLIQTTDTEPTSHTVSAYYEGNKRYWQVFSNSGNSTDPLQLLGNFLETIINPSIGGYSLTMTTWKQSITAGHCSYPLEVFPSRLNGTYIVPFVYSVVDLTEIITSTTVAEGNSHYNVPSDENNLAFITYEISVS